MSCELDLSHTAGTESLCEGVVTKELAGASARPARLALLTVGHGQSQSAVGAFLYTRPSITNHHKSVFLSYSAVVACKPP